MTSSAIAALLALLGTGVSAPSLQTARYSVLPAHASVRGPMPASVRAYAPRLEYAIGGQGSRALAVRTPAAHGVALVFDRAESQGERLYGAGAERDWGRLRVSLANAWGYRDSRTSALELRYSADSTSITSVRMVESTLREPLRGVRLGMQWSEPRWRAGLSARLEPGARSAMRPHWRGELGVRMANALWLEWGSTRDATSPAKLASLESGTIGVRLDATSLLRDHGSRARERERDARFDVRRRGDFALVTYEGLAFERVEVMGAFSDWTPVPLVREGSRWRARVALRAGANAVLMRVDDGAWVPPPGLPIGADPFSGVVGVITFE